MKSSRQLNPRAIHSLAFPLDEFYAMAGRALPEVSAIDGAEMPEPHRSLLVHLNDMTSTLENFHGDRLKLEVLSSRVEGDVYLREVLLRLEKSGKPVEFGAILIHLDRFDPEPRRLILSGKVPLGRVLAEQKVPFTSRPNGFFRIAADSFIGPLLSAPESTGLYARRNTLSNPAGLPLAEIVEILPL